MNKTSKIKEWQYIDQKSAVDEQNNQYKLMQCAPRAFPALSEGILSSSSYPSPIRMGLAMEHKKASYKV